MRSNGVTGESWMRIVHQLPDSPEPRWDVFWDAVNQSLEKANDDSANIVGASERVLQYFQAMYAWRLRSKSAAGDLLNELESIRLALAIRLSISDKVGPRQMLDVHIERVNEVLKAAELLADENKAAKRLHSSSEGGKRDPAPNLARVSSLEVRREGTEYDIPEEVLSYSTRR